jgi:hypothetical protein
MTRAEASSLLRAAGVALGEDDVGELYRRTEGWAAGLYLAALYLREGGLLPGAAVSSGGRVVLGQRAARGSAGVLHGRRGRRHSRTAGAEALAGDRPPGPDRHLPALVPVTGRPGRDQGTPDARRAGGIPRCEGGSPAEAERWAEVLDRWQDQDAARPADPSAEAWAAVVRAVLCRRGVEQMRADADEAARRLAAENIVAPVASLAQGVARVLCGDPGGADAFLQTRPAPQRTSARTRFAPSRCANGRWWRWRAVNGAGPKARPARYARCCARPGSRTATPRPWPARCRPGWPAPGRCPGGPPGTRPCSAAAVVATVYAASPGRSGPDRAHPRAPRVG